MLKLVVDSSLSQLHSRKLFNTDTGQVRNVSESHGQHQWQVIWVRRVASARVTLTVWRLALAGHKNLLGLIAVHR